jgi:hypothetical protein
MDHEKFKNVADGIRSLVLAVAAIAAGGWAYFTFTSLGSVKKAAIDQAEVEQRIRRAPVLQIELSAKPALASADGHLVLVEVVLKNDGKQDLKLVLPESPLLLSRVSISGDSMKASSRLLRAPHVTIEQNGELKAVPERIFRAGQSRSIPFAVRVPESGDYLVQFLATYYGVELHNGLDQPTDEGSIDAVAQLFIHVGQNKRN